MNSCLCTLPDPSAIVLEIDRHCRTQLFGIPIKPTSVEALSNSMELDCEIYCLVPNFEVLKAPMWTAGSQPPVLFRSIVSSII